MLVDWLWWHGAKVAVLLDPLLVNSSWQRLDKKAMQSWSEGALGPQGRLARLPERSDVPPDCQALMRERASGLSAVRR